MARLKSEDKRTALIEAAIELIAAEGASAATAKIARRAGVAEGSLFTYFKTKDELLNQVYLDLKAELRDVMLTGFTRSTTAKTRIRHGWQRYVNWGVAFPAKRKVLAQLGVDDRISASTREAGNLAFVEFNRVLNENLATGPMRKLPAAFAASLLGAMADVTMDFMLHAPAQAENYSAAGFEAFWNALMQD